MINKLKSLKKEQLLIGALIGILLLVIVVPVPEENAGEDEQIVETEIKREETADSLQMQLKNVLQKISGVGQVEVLITYKDHGKIVVEKDETISEEQVQETDSSGGTRNTTTRRNEKQTIYDAGETPYVVQEILPEIEGILVVAQGAGNDSVKNQIQATIEALFGLDAHKISIMKMEVSK